MEKIIIENVGPIKSVEIDLNKINVFMGPQSSGKSTIAKIISYCLWVEKNCIISDSTEKFDTPEKFYSEIEIFHDMRGYFRDDSYLSYESDYFKVSVLGFQNDKYELRFKNRDEYLKSKISYIPAERCVATIEGIKSTKFLDNNIRNYIFDWDSINSKYINYKILNLGITYYYNSEAREAYIKGKDYDILLSQASSGLRSVIPLLMLSDYFTDWIYKNEEPTSVEKKQMLTNREKYLFKKYVEQPLFDIKVIKDDLTYIDRPENEIIEKLKNEPDRLKRILLMQKYIDNYFVHFGNIMDTHYTNLIIEEPEQNLFPEIQYDLIYHIIRLVKQKDKHRLILTTHSPYILYALNNCVLGGIVQKNLNEDAYDRIKCQDSFIKPQDISICQLTNEGRLSNIQEKDGLIAGNYFDDQMKKLMDEFRIMLKFYND